MARKSDGVLADITRAPEGDIQRRWFEVVVSIRHPCFMALFMSALRSLFGDIGLVIVPLFVVGLVSLRLTADKRNRQGRRVFSDH